MKIFGHYISIKKFLGFFVLFIRAISEDTRIIADSIIDIRNETVNPTLFNISQFSNPIIFYYLNAFNESFKIEFTNDNLVRKNVQNFLKIRADLSEIFLRQFDTSCYWFGKISGLNKSGAFVNTCGNTKGFMFTQNLFYRFEKIENVTFFIQKNERIISPPKNIYVAENRKIEVESEATSTENILGLDRSNKVDGTRVNRYSSQLDTSNVFYVEIVAFVDNKAAYLYGNNLETFISTVIYGANDLFSRPRLNVNIQLTLNKLILVRRKRQEFYFKNNTKQDYAKFCNWQSSYNADNFEDPNHYDMAILFTTRTLYSDGRIVQGLSPVGEVCKSGGSCVIIHNSGDLSSMMIVVAHEIGHQLNMLHDNNKLCFKENGYNISTIMSSLIFPTYGQISSASPWSRCSSLAVQALVVNENGKCLRNKPYKPINFPERLPGEIYNATEHCRMVFGTEATSCTAGNSSNEYCSSITCEGETFPCVRHYSPRLDGTPCGFQLVCRAGKCISRKQLPQRINGQWSEWSSFGSCSRTCDGGIMKSERRCNSPLPTHGGNICPGVAFRYRTCNRRRCNPKLGRSDFRKEQCNQLFAARFESLTGERSERYEPEYFDIEKNQRCQLHCKSKSISTLLFRNSVIDGTRCGPDSTDVCIHGDCFKTGCDGIIGSSAQYNQCGLCGKSNEYCVHNQGELPHTNWEYKSKAFSLWKFPIGATNISYLIIGSHGSLSLLDTDKNTFVSSHTLIGNERFVYYGTTLYCNFSNDSSTLFVPWRLNRPLYIQMHLDSSNGTDGGVFERWSFYLAIKKKYRKIER